MSHPLASAATRGETRPTPFGDPANPLGLDGIEFIEYVTSDPRALGQVLAMMGFRPVARHRSREVLLYRQGDLNIVVNAHPAGAQDPDDENGPAPPSIAAMALRVQDARCAYHCVLERGAWSVPTHADVMELNIPAIQGAGNSRIYFVDRYTEFSIYDVDFVPLPCTDQRPPTTCNLHFFGLVQQIGPGRRNDWIQFYNELFGTELLAPAPRGALLRAPALRPERRFMLQLMETDSQATEVDERLVRIGLGTPDVPAAVQALRSLGMAFAETASPASTLRSAITRTYLDAVAFELVHSERA